jgi:ABC-type transport system involved in multi-copper enzyme maturation permease subunit
MIMVVLLTPGMVAGVIAEERERKTMPSLLATRLTSGEIVIGKLCARLLHLACFIALGLPILVLVQHFGGVGLKGVLITFAATATTAFFLGAASILVSTFARRPRDAVVSSYMLDVVWNIGTAAVLVFFSTGLLHMLVGWIAMTCPLVVMFGHVRGTRFWESPNLDDIVRMIVLQVALGAVMTTLAVRRLRPALRNDDSSHPVNQVGQPKVLTPESKLSQQAPNQTEPQPVRSSLQVKTENDVTPAGEPAPPELTQAEPPTIRFRPRPPCGDDAMLWKEIRATPFSLFTRVVCGLVLATMFILAAMFCFGRALASAEELFENGYSAEYEDLYHRLELSVALRYLVTMTAGLMLLWVSIVAACSLAGERDKNTWSSLISTPLSGFEIMRSKILGACWSARALLALWVTLVMIGLVVGSVHPLGGLAVTLATVTYLAFGCVLGMFYSLRAPTSSHAVVWTLATLIVLNGAYLLLFWPLNIRSELTLMGVTPFVEEVALLNYLDVKWLIDFESPDKRMLAIALTCVLSVALYGSATIVLALWTLKAFDHVIDRPVNRDASARV